MNKKIFFRSLGIIIALATPVGALVACSPAKSDKDKNKGGSDSTSAKTTWSWDKTFPSSTIYETSTAGEYTTDKTRGNGYVARASGKTATIATPTANKTINIDGKTYSYNTTGSLSFDKWYNSQSKAPNNKFPSNLIEVTARPQKHTLLTSNVSVTQSDLSAMGFTDSDKLYLSDDNLTKQTVSYANISPLTSITWTSVKAKSWKAGDKIFFLDYGGSFHYYYALVVQKQPGWDKTFPSSTIYETSKAGEYTTNESLAKGYVAEAMRTVSKTKSDFEKQIKADPTNNTVTIDGTTYTYTKSI